MKTMCPPGYHHNGFVATHALGHMMRDINNSQLPLHNVSWVEPNLQLALQYNNYLF